MVTFIPGGAGTRRSERRAGGGRKEHRGGRERGRKEGRREERKEGVSDRGEEAAGSAEEDVAGPAERATSDRERTAGHEPDHPQVPYRSAASLCFSSPLCDRPAPHRTAPRRQFLLCRRCQPLPAALTAPLTGKSAPDCGGRQPRPPAACRPPLPASLSLSPRANSS